MNLVSLKKPVFVFLLSLFLILQIYFMVSKYLNFSSDSLLDPKSLERYPDLIFGIGGNLPSVTWATSTSDQIESLQDWLSQDEMNVTISKKNNSITFSFIAAQGTQPSMVLSKMRIIPHLKLKSISVQTAKDQRFFEFQYQF